MNLPMLAHDKANHVIYGVMLSSAVLMLSILLGLPAPAAVAMGVNAVFAIGKELYDLHSGKGNPEAADALVTLAGGWFVVLPYLVQVHV